MAAESDLGIKLSQIFDNSIKSYTFLETCDEPTSSSKVQEEVKSSIEKCECGVRMVNTLSLFSENEEFEEIATADIRYMLLPGFLGYFTLKNTLDERLEVIKRAQAYYADYLRLVKLYGVTDVKIPEIPKEEDESANSTVAISRPGPPDLDAMNRERAAKIEQFKRQKELEARLKGLEEKVSTGAADDDTQREYYKMLLEKWVCTSLEELRSMAAEVPILKHMAKMKAQNSGGGAAPPPKPKEPPKPKFRPFILTRNQLQAQVIGAGYPSLPTYTLDQFYEMRYKDECEQKTNLNGMDMDQLMDPDAEARQKEADDAQKEALTENDDEETLRKARDWDDWKDDHRRGWGNTHNMG